MQCVNSGNGGAGDQVLVGVQHEARCMCIGICGCMYHMAWFACELVFVGFVCVCVLVRLCVICLKGIGRSIMGRVRVVEKHKDLGEREALGHATHY